MLTLLRKIRIGQAINGALACILLLFLVMAGLGWMSSRSATGVPAQAGTGGGPGRE